MIRDMRYVTDSHQIPSSRPEEWQPLLRRGFELGWVSDDARPAAPAADEVAYRWRQDKASILPGIIDVASWQSEIGAAHALMEEVLDADELSPLLEKPPYIDRLGETFPLVASSFEEHDEQGIEKVYFDADQDGEPIAENLWCKASWLSFIEEDASLRFRFSFGMECLEDVAADPGRQLWAGRLCDTIFPESKSITENPQILSILENIVGGEPAFVERIVYFNAPNGGAQMHHDVERGHDGVVFAQLSGSTFWLALAKPLLIDALIDFITNPANSDEVTRLLPDATDRLALAEMLSDRAVLSAYMDEFDHELVEAVMDRSALFTQHLVEKGYGYILHAGDVLLMPQRDLDNCVWHSVICLGDEPGEALSFAVRRK
ncbi:hypothetical protein Ga0123462_0115 [Mariprofundus ferrinatatus]|uniref:Uncharacterized protein n=1 Tax=Mariprofundus ferrinatatus TaxID=1921087 RepID=A0A2K8L7T5_9PROT|nr:hypothetical protein [Mariprofundus ferrinatatus]ATX80994.1 hypothetical protein Ga0123462_0115 [Mariprofundus ferrinatatus]